ncbi:TetR/AcrR family transcriptional regulator [Azospirillum thermophilum]|uniref:TetR family transcriptional regulator n=1 Tax=Azospirillum thermophilum TaxID=2202148 RepID=A0A2S2CYE4_9PROT|nr:TetR/AcrR family transcriptional regulator [Azospirillum thermophilum]AWK89488.1 TetR family transcriptional regulator [Azospirillum thermophilum]
MSDASLSDSPWKPTPDRRTEREAKRIAVLRTAARAFNEMGYHTTSLDDIARRLNVTKPTIYYYVRNKEEILFECVRIGLEMLDEASNEVMGHGGSAHEELIAVMRRYVEIVTMDFGMCVIRVGEEPLTEDSRRTLRGLKRSIDRKFRGLIERGVAEGSIGPCDPKIAAFTLAGALSWIARWYRPDGDLSVEEIADGCIALLMTGLAAGTPPRARTQAGQKQPNGTSRGRRGENDHREEDAGSGGG